MDATSSATTTLLLARADFVMKNANLRMQAIDQAKLKETPIFSMEPPKQ